MADISITATSVGPIVGTTKTATGVAGETVTAGMPVYLKASDGLLYKADANASSATAAMVGVALHGATAGQPLTYAVPGTTYTAGATLVAGSLYILSVNAGAIAPAGDIATNSYTTLVGYATTTAIMKVLGTASGTVYAGAGGFAA